MYICAERPAVCRQWIPLDSGGTSSKAGGEFAGEENGVAPDKKPPKALKAKSCRKRRREKSAQITLLRHINGSMIQTQREQPLQRKLLNKQFWSSPCKDICPSAAPMRYQLHSPTTSNWRSFPVGITTVSLWRPASFAARPFTVTDFS